MYTSDNLRPQTARFFENKARYDDKTVEIQHYHNNLERVLHAVLCSLINAQMLNVTRVVVRYMIPFQNSFEHKLIDFCNGLFERFVK
jgi:hypothetical protein